MAQRMEEERLPFIEFEKRFTPRNAPPGEESTGFVEEDLIIITPLGSKDKIEKIATQHLAQMRQQVSEKRIPQKFYTDVKGAYELWKKGESFDFGGTPIELLNLSKSQMVMLRSFKVRSIEDLAGANEELLSLLGMGARALQMRAKTFMEQKPMADITNELTSLRQSALTQAEHIARLERDNAELRKMVGVRDNPQPLPERDFSGNERPILPPDGQLDAMLNESANLMDPKAFEATPG